VLALAHRPQFLLLDEPTSGLDPTARRVLVTLVADAARENGCGVLFSSHDIGEVDRLADRLVIIHDGAIRLDDSLAALRARNGTTGGWSLERLFLEVVQ